MCRSLSLRSKLNPPHRRLGQLHLARRSIRLAVNLEAVPGSWSGILAGLSREGGRPAVPRTALIRHLGGKQGRLYGEVREAGLVSLAVALVSPVRLYCCTSGEEGHDNRLCEGEIP